MEVEQDHIVMSGRYGGQKGDSCHGRMVVHRGETRGRVVEWRVSFSIFF